MIKLDPNPTVLTSPAEADFVHDRRLIVLISQGTDYSAATRRIWELAHATNMPVLLLGLCNDATEQPGLRRELITMASLLQAGKVTAEVKVDIGSSWLDSVRNHFQAEDRIVCLSEQRAGLLRRPLSQILESNFKATVYILPGLTLKTSDSNRLLPSMTWLGSLGIVIGFGILQAKMVQLPQNSLQNALLILSIFPEFWLIWVWNSLFE